MNRKGFTLIELLCTITIMTLIATIASFNMTKLFDTGETLNEDEIIETAACVYIELKENEDLKNTCLSTGCNISTDVLINSGLLNEEDVSEEKIIHIYKDQSEKKCVIQGSE